MAEVEMAALQPPGSSTPVSPRSRRETWGSSIERIVTLLGMCLGTLVITFYPYMHFRAGGVNFILFLLMILLVGVPLLLLEYFVGQFTSSDCIGVFAHYPAFKGIGIVSCLLILVILPCFTVTVSYSLIYVGHSFTSVNEWGSCSNIWNTIGCIPLENISLSREGSYTRDWYYNSNPGDEFFSKNVLQNSFSIFNTDGLVWPQVVASLMICLLIFVCLIFGLRGLGKVCCFTLGMSLILSLALFIRAVTLPGAWEGMRYFFAMDADDLNFSTLTLALSYVFYSYGLGHGLYSTLGSYNNFRNKFTIDILIVSIGSTVFSLFVGIIIFCLMGFIAKETETEFSMNQGLHSPYATLTAAFYFMPDSQFWAVVFFSFIFFASVDSLLVMVQVVVQCIQNHISVLRNRRIPALLVVCGLTFINCLLYCSRSGLQWITLIDVTVSYVSTILGFLEIIVFAYVYGAGRLTRDLEMLSNIFVSYYCYFTWLFITPALGLLLLINYHLFAYHAYIDGAPLGLLTALSLVTFIPVYGIYYVLRGDCCNKYKGEKAAPWGPKAEVDIAAWKDFCLRRKVRYVLLHRTFR